MITSNDFISLPYTSDLTSGGLAHAIHSLPYIHAQPAQKIYQIFQHLAAATAVELGIRRYLSEQNILFTVKKSLNFSQHDQYDIFLAGGRLHVQTLQLEANDSIWQTNYPPEELFSSRVILPSEQHRAIQPSRRDVYLFALIVKSKPQIIVNERYLIHILPGFWRQPRQWNPLGSMTCKSAGLEKITLEITGQLVNQEISNTEVNLVPGEQAAIQAAYYSLTSIHVDQLPTDLIGIKSPDRAKVYLIRPDQWKDAWLTGSHLILVGWIGLEEFTRQSTLIRPGVKIFPYGIIEEKSMGFPITELKPMAALFDQPGIHDPIKTFSA
jgi:hypothetical protein